MKPYPKNKRSDPKYLSWIRSKPCCICWYPPQSEAAHMRILGRGGISLKPPDRDALPMCENCHSAEHRGSVTFFEQGTKAETKMYVQGLCDGYIEQYELSIRGA